MRLLVGFVKDYFGYPLELGADIEHAFHAASFFIHGEQFEEAYNLVHQADV